MTHLLAAQKSFIIAVRVRQNMSKRRWPTSDVFFQRMLETLLDWRHRELTTAFSREPAFFQQLQEQQQLKRLPQQLAEAQRQVAPPEKAPPPAPARSRA